MPFHIQTFKTRTLTALVFVAIMLTGLFLNFWSFLILFTLIHFGCWYEWIKLIKKIHQHNYFFYSLLGLMYITLPLLLLLDLKKPWLNISPAAITNEWNNIFPVAIIFSIWLNDTAAYIVGSFIGKTPLSKISPKKTIEGTIGGMILCILIMGFVFPLLLNFNFLKSAKPWFIIAAICSFFGTLGDLLESKLKRMAKVKDSGSFMPGHGGFLDRFDSLLICVPFVWIYIKFFFQV